MTPENGSDFYVVVSVYKFSTTGRVAWPDMEMVHV